MTDKDKRAEVEEHMAEILDGDAPQELYNAIADSDDCRDARHEAEEAVNVVRDAAADYELPQGLESKLLTALDEQNGDGTRSRPLADDDGSVESRATKSTDDGVHARPLADEVLPPKPEEPDAKCEPERTGTNSANADTAHAPHTGPLSQPDEGDSRGMAKVTELASRRRAKLGLVAILTAGAAAAAVGLALRTDKPGAPPPSGEGWHGEITHVANAAGVKSGIELCNPRGEACSQVKAGANVPVGAWLRTDGRTRVHLTLNDGTELSLDRDTELSLSSERSRQASLTHGGIVADIARVKDVQAHFSLPHGAVEVLGTKFALQTNSDSATVNVSRGAVRLSDRQQRSVTVRAGEEGRLYAGSPPYASTATALGEALAWSDSTIASPDEEVAVKGLGELRAKKPGSKQEKKGAVTLTSHSVKVRISGAVARTEVDETFTNHTGDVLEGIYRFPMPPDAKIERLALEVDGKLEEGAFLDRDRAASIWRGAIVQAAPQLRRQMREEIVWVPGPWKDPALLEWQRGGRFELRIYPIPKQGSRRVVLAYTQVIQPTAGVRRYTYPLAHDPSGSTKVDTFNVDLQVRGHDGAFGVRSRGYELTREGSGPSVEKLGLAARQFVPNGDLTVEYALPDRDSELTAWAYQPSPAEKPQSPAKATVAKPSAKADSLSPTIDDNSPYVALALRPRLPRVTADEHRSFVVVVDSSRSMFGESYSRATTLATRVVQEMDRLDRFTVLACDTTCRTLPGGLRAPSSQAALDTRQFLEKIQPEGGSDITAAVRSARTAASTEAGRALRMVYIGDGTPTVGPIRPAYVTRAVQEALPPGRSMLTAVAIGADSDLDSLGAMARGGGGVVLPYVPGRTTAEVAYSVLGATYGSSLRNVTVTLPDGLVEVAPRNVDTIVAGGESVVVARMTEPEISGSVVLKGKVGNESFEQRYPVKLAASTSAGNAFVPRLYAATRISDLERAPDAKAKTEAIKLSSAFNVASRHTSLLVLESAAMFKAFGLDNTRRAPEWTGEEDTEATLAEGEFEVAADDDGLGLGAIGSSSRSATKKSAGGRVDSGEMGFGGGGDFAGAPKAKRRAAASARSLPRPMRRPPKTPIADEPLEFESEEPPPHPGAG